MIDKKTVLSKSTLFEISNLGVGSVNQDGKLYLIYEHDAKKYKDDAVKEQKKIQSDLSKYMCRQKAVEYASSLMKDTNNNKSLVESAEEIYQWLIKDL